MKTTLVIDTAKAFTASVATIPQFELGEQHTLRIEAASLDAGCKLGLAAYTLAGDPLFAVHDMTWTTGVAEASFGTSTVQAVAALGERQRMEIIVGVDEYTGTAPNQTRKTIAQFKTVLYRDSYAGTENPETIEQAVVAVETATAQAVIATQQAGLATTAKTAAEAAQTAAELAASQTEADTIATAADRVQTGLDRQAAEGAAVQTGLDVQATAGDRVQTGLDRAGTTADALATAADRAQTGIDRDAAAYSANEATNAADTATAQAGIATTKAGEADTSATTATTKAGEAATSAQTATTKAGEAAASATQASTVLDASVRHDTAQALSDAARDTVLANIGTGLKYSVLNAVGKKALMRAALLASGQAMHIYLNSTSAFASFALIPAATTPPTLMKSMSPIGLDTSFEAGLEEHSALFRFGVAYGNSGTAGAGAGVMHIAALNQTTVQVPCSFADGAYGSLTLTCADSSTVVIRSLYTSKSTEYLWLRIGARSGGVKPVYVYDYATSAWKLLINCPSTADGFRHPQFGFVLGAGFGSCHLKHDNLHGSLVYPSAISISDIF